MTSNVVENDTVEIAILTNQYIDPEIVSIALLEVIQTQKQAQISKIRKFDIEMSVKDLFDLKDDLRYY